MRMTSKVDIKAIYEQLKIYYYEIVSLPQPRSSGILQNKNLQSNKYYTTMSLFEIYKNYYNDR